MVRSWVMVESCDRNHDCWRWEYCTFRDQRVLDPGEYVLIEKVDGEWPEWAVKTVWKARGFDRPYRDSSSAILDALARGEQP